MRLATTLTFRPNALSTDIAYDALQGYRRSQCGGTVRDSDGVLIAFLSNETATPWYSGSPISAKIGTARDIDSGIDLRWRAMFRFVLREITIDAAGLVSGPWPAATWWPHATAARLIWWNGDGLGLQGVEPLVNSTSDLIVRVGRGLYVPVGAQERPFGKDNGEAASSAEIALTLGMEEAILTWAQWADPSRVWRTLVLSTSSLAQYVQTITGPTNDFLDVSMYTALEGVDGTDVAREIGAWEPKPPRLEVDFDLPVEKATAFRRSGASVAVRRSGRATTFRRSGAAVAVRRSGAVSACRRSGAVIATVHG